LWTKKPPPSVPKQIEKQEIKQIQDIKRQSKSSFSPRIKNESLTPRDNPQKVDLNQITKGRGNEKGLIINETKSRLASKPNKKPPSTDQKKTLNLLNQMEKQDQEQGLMSQFSQSKEKSTPEKSEPVKIEKPIIKSSSFGQNSQSSPTPKDFQLKKTNNMEKLEKKIKYQ